MKEQYKRVSPDAVLRNLNPEGGTKAAAWFKLPPNVEIWQPTKAGSYVLDFYPYVVKSNEHPDRSIGIGPGHIWWKHPFQVAHGIGINNESVVSPATFGRPCPIVEERKLLYSQMNKLPKNSVEWIQLKKQVTTLRVQRMSVYIIEHPEKRGQIAIFPFSQWSFEEQLFKDISTMDKNVSGFWDVDEKGRTVTVRFYEEEFTGDDGQGKYLKAQRFDFAERGVLDQDEILARVPCLDECFNVYPYDQLKAMFHQVPTDEGQMVENVTQPVPRKASDKPAPVARAATAPQPSPKVTEVKAEPKVEAKPEPKAEAKTETKADTNGEWKVGDPIIFMNKGKTVIARITELELEDDFVVCIDDSGEEFDPNVDDISHYKGDEAPAATATAAKPKLAVGSKVSWDNGDESGEVVRIHSSGQKVKVKDKTGDESWVKVEEVTLI